MLKKGRFLAMSMPACGCLVQADQLHPRIAIIKADDIRRPTEYVDMQSHNEDSDTAAVPDSQLGLSIKEGQQKAQELTERIHELTRT